MIADPKRKPHQDDSASDKRRGQEEALDEALENTFPASDPVSGEQPTTTGAPVIPDLKIKRWPCLVKNFIHVRNLGDFRPKVAGNHHQVFSGE
jgi:hypothetical protein